MPTGRALRRRTIRATAGAFLLGSFGESPQAQYIMIVMELVDGGELAGSPDTVLDARG